MRDAARRVVLNGMADRTELARREAFATWMEALRWWGLDDTQLRTAELAFEKWWRSLSRRELQDRSPRRRK